MNSKASFSLTAALAVCAFVFASAANAKTAFSGKFTLPYDVHWGTSVVPAGDYTLIMSDSEPLASIRSVNGETRFISEFPTRGDRLKAGCYLYITLNEGQHWVRYLNVPTLGEVLVYKPLTKFEREEIARSDRSRVVPVTVAKK